MKTEEVKQIAITATRNIKTQPDLAQFQQLLTNVTVEGALNAASRTVPGAYFGFYNERRRH